MPACTTYNFFRVKWAGVASTTGIYYPADDLTNNFSVFIDAVNFNDGTGYPRLQVYNLSGSHWAWGLFTAANTPRYRSSIIYTTNASVVTCPHNLTWVHTSGQGGDLPTIEGLTVADTYREAVSIISSSQIANLVSSQNPKFYAFNGPSQTTTGATATVVQFTSLGHNVGNGFNLDTDSFTAPVAGYYQFMFNAMGDTNNVVRFRLYKNGSTYGPEFYTAPQTFENFGGNWQLYLNVGDIVDLRFGFFAGEVNSIYANFRAFSGFLIP